MTFTHPKLTS